ncbi:DUF421 domain-containing protein [Mucilaginibacter rubeus]|uniref:DUF421 domain-containing protein n=1 Tax=Mucilaginibacter rubeus TaxID=2027860 RepID=A0A5C1HWC9_9SPHI|nr:YetF domain-containing protein [Mucilaginibacter rubeus]QEM09975.1 DUF421 domain-containing protein [Mucilaginibacter rubeus]
MEALLFLFGAGDQLNALQMSCRGVVFFLIALILIRISGRRSFGLRMPLDNIVIILLGAVMSRAVVGASPFIPVVVSCLVIVLLHRLFGWFVARSGKFSYWTEGHKFLLFHDGKFDHEEMCRALVCKEDVMQGVRRSALTTEMDTIDKVYMERNGEVSVIRKKD